MKHRSPFRYGNPWLAVTLLGVTAMFFGAAMLGVYLQEVLG